MLKNSLRGGLIGENIGRSRLELALRILCARTGRILDFTAFDTTTMQNFNFESHLTLLRGRAFDGVTITHPWKVRADALSDRRIDYPKTVGASNLLRFGSNATQSFNTDYTGMIAAWRSKFGDANPGQVAIAGAGGVARAIAGAMVELGARSVVIWDTSHDRANQLASDIDSNKTVISAIAIQDARSAVFGADGLINATPIGTREYPGISIPPDWWGPKNQWAFDAVYTPIQTRFMVAAMQRGLACLSGFDLFTHMAVRSFAAYTDSEIDADAIKLLMPLAEGL